MDSVALSFVRSADDIQHGEELMRKFGRSVPLVAKLEKPQAIEHLEEILEVTDGVMIARGDLGVELPPERVPIIQKQVIQRAGVWRKPVITATQMLESMTENPRPTRAEASDVANAIFDGTDAVMLSGETASWTLSARSGGHDGAHHSGSRGQHRAICRQRRDAGTSSVVIRLPKPFASRSHTPPKICRCARSPSSRRAATPRACCPSTVPKVCIYAFSRKPEVCNRMNHFGVCIPIHKEQWESAESMLRTAEDELLQRGLLRIDDVLGLVAGTKLTSGATNFMRLHTVEASDPVRAARRKKK